MRKGILSVFLAVVLIGSTVGLAEAALYIDHFDNVTITKSHWTSVSPNDSTWTMIGVSGDTFDGYQGTTNITDGIAAVAYDYQTKFANANLNIETIFQVHEDSIPTHDGGGLFIGFDGSDGIAAGINVDNDTMYLGNIAFLEDTSVPVGTDLLYDTLYKLAFSTSSTTAYLSIFNDFTDSASALKTITFDLGDFALSSGAVGIFAGQSATFDNFLLSGEIAPVPTPVPGAVWIFGSGLLSIIGLRRRMK